MVSESPSGPVFPADIYVQVARVCTEVQTEQFKGSRMLVRAKQCSFCHNIVKLGAGASDYSLTQHMLSKQCQLAQQKLALAGSSLISSSEESKPRTSSAKAISSVGSHPFQLHAPSLPAANNIVSGGLDFCPGAIVDYGMSTFSHYPWHLHDTDFLDYELSYIDPKGQFIYVQSRKCDQKSPGDGMACKACNQIVFSRQFQELIKRADPTKPPPHSLNLQFRTHPQLCQLLHEKNDQIKTLQLKGMTTQRRIQTLSGRMDNQLRLTSAIAQLDDIGAGRIVQTALRNRAGVETIINRLVKAHQGLFNPHSYSEKQLQVAGLYLKIGGPRLAYAMAKALHLPSISMVRGHLHLPQLKPSIAFPTQEEVCANIESFFGPAAAISNHSCCAGVSLMLDELASEPRMRYSIEQDAVVGICREHSDKIGLDNMSSRPDPLATLSEAKSLLDSGECHRAAETTMAAIARFGQSNYNAAVILASPTCKTGKAMDQSHLIKIILESWRQSPHGEAAHGKICPSHVTHDGDYKHEEKRLASALRSRSGVLVNGVHITPKMLVKYLKLLGTVSEARILSFFDGTDPQNVPKANALLSSLFQASQLPSVLLESVHKPFALLGEVLGSFTRPYTVPEMSLTEQITSLAKCSHLLFALYRVDGTKFLPAQLIYDIQASIKNVLFCVAKTQLADQNLPFYLLQTGTDRLETRFGTYRTVTSDRNGDILQMCERAASAQHIDSIFSANPAWNRAPYRLSLDGKAGVDHTNPSSWKGDVIVGHVDLSSCWLDGQHQAADSLRRAHVPFEFDPVLLSAESPDIDLMRPTGRYPGVQIDNIEHDLPSVTLSELTDSPLIPDTNAAGPSDASGDALGTPLHIGDDELTIEHLLPATPGYHLETGGKKGWIFVEGQPVHLESAVRYWLGLDGGAKSTDRLRRVCGYTRYLHPSTEGSSILGEDFHISELVATFLRVGDQVAIAIVRVTNIIAKDGRLLESISEKQLHEPGVTLSGQILKLEYDTGVWYWTQQYDSAADASPSAHRKRHAGVDFAAHFALAVNPELVERNGDQIWSFADAQMYSLMDELWHICANQSPEDQIPSCQPSASFPYSAPNSQNTLLHLGAATYIQNATPPTEGACYVCGEQVKIKRAMRIHIGQHLLALRLRSEEVTPTVAVGAEMPPCGFCGRHGTCISTAERQPKATKTLQVVSNCPYKDKLTYSSSPQTSQSNPCTNRPTECPRCPPGSRQIWSYMLRQHVITAHGSQAHAELDEDLKKYDPTDNEYGFMRVNKTTGVVQVAKRSKRRRETVADVSVPSSSRQKC